MTQDPGASPRTGIGGHYLRYLSGNVLVMLAGFVSLPILSRLLSDRDFGIIGYYEALGAIWLAITKMGTSHAIQRHYATHFLGGSEEEQQRFHATLVGAPALISGATTAAVLAVLGARYLAGAADVGYLVLVALTCQVGVLLSLGQNVILSSERSQLLSSMQAASRWVQLAFVLVAAGLLARSALGVLTARLLADLAILCWVAAWARRHVTIVRRAFSLPLFKAALLYGAPMALGELCTIILNSVDRVILSYFLDFKAVGIYHINYSIASYLGVLLQASVGPAFTPVAIRVFEAEGREGALALQRQLMRVVYYGCAALCVAIVLVAPALLRLMVGEAKANFSIFAWVSMIYILATPVALATHGLILTRRTRAYLVAVAASGLTNIACNFALIPRFGLMGAVYATLAGFGVLAAVQLTMCPSEFIPWPRPAELLRPAGLAAALYLAARWAVPADSGLPLRLALVGALFVIVYLLPALAWEPDFRAFAARRLPFARGRG